jgi:hypothetical protein
MTLRRCSTFSLRVDASVVDQGVEALEGVDLLGEVASLRLAGEVADHDGRCSVSDGPKVSGSRHVAGVQHHLVASVEHRLGRGETKTGRGAGHEHPCHPSSRCLFIDPARPLGLDAGVALWPSSHEGLESVWGSFRVSGV